LFLQTPYPQRIKIIVVCAALMIGLALYASSFLPSVIHVENRIYDFFLQTRPSPPGASEIVIVFIGDDTISAAGSWPLTRDYHAMLIHILNEFEAGQVVFDFLFSEKHPQNSNFDQALVDQAKLAGNVYLPYFMFIGSSTGLSTSPSSDAFEFGANQNVALETNRIAFPMASGGIFQFPVSDQAHRISQIFFQLPVFP